MKVKYLALALAAMSAGAANAYTDNETNLYITGASAIRNNVAASIKKLCGDAGGALTVYKNGSGVSSLANQMAYVCTEPMAGTSITTVLHTTTGGSLNSILGMSSSTTNKAPDGAFYQQQPMSFSGCDASANAGTGALAGYSVKANCGLDTKAASNGGFSDVEYGPAIGLVEGLDADADGFTIGDVSAKTTGVAQAFGVAVNNRMYKDLQTAQGIVGKAISTPTDINGDGDTSDSSPNESGTCDLGNPLPDCQPSLSSLQIRALISSNLSTAEKKNASALGLTAGTPITYLKRPVTSGTQTSAQVFFLSKGCANGPAGGELDVVAPGPSYNGGKFIVTNNSGTGNVLNALATATNYYFGIVSAENRAPVTMGTDAWRFIKVDGAAISDGTATGLNKKTAIKGDYPFFFEPVGYKGPEGKTSTDEAALIDAIADKMALKLADDGPTTVGLFISPVNPSGYAYDGAEVGKLVRGGSSPSSCQPLQAF
ncbi:hypothetical protein [Rhodocyclus tenuis]|uniref:PBP domain-containing protein n=1 Tax=Rhodocyclus tenuis TaxID=1066 RepID=A0A840G1P5_RHOTE|nr:hypothetical protein [Rhodocyclus tenuis]MBB4248327.1 hypothetical protein [Rhodocyclus tenuis]